MNPIFPSILSTNFFDLESHLDIFQQTGIDHIHLDIMDGHFVDNLSFGPSAAKALKSRFPFIIDAHLMVSNPEKLVPKFMSAGADWVSFHIEASDEIENLIGMIQAGGCKAGIVLNPDTPVKSVIPYLDKIDYILLMSVFPGYGGQSFIEGTVPRVKELKHLIDELGVSCLIQVDGGINTSNVKRLKSAGSDIFVIGTFLYNASNIDETMDQVLEQIKIGE